MFRSLRCRLYQLVLGVRAAAGKSQKIYCIDRANPIIDDDLQSDLAHPLNGSLGPRDTPDQKPEWTEQNFTHGCSHELRTTVCAGDGRTIADQLDRRNGGPSVSLVCLSCTKHEGPGVVIDGNRDLIIRSEINVPPGMFSLERFLSRSI